MTLVLVVNAGSTSLKLSVVDEDSSTRTLESLDDAPHAVAAVGHRVVHGGARFREPVLIDEDVARGIAELRPIAPLHNEPALRAIEAARRALPEVPHVAVFDTAFHATMPPEAATYALPARWRDEWGVRRYGFHGLSVAWSAERAAELLGSGPNGLRLVVCHLGGGCSVTAVRDGSSVDTTMGFSPLEGVPMATRSGSVDPGVLLFLLREKGLSPDELDRALERESGLLGLSGSSGSVRELEAAAEEGDRAARLALDVYVHRIAGAISALTSSLGGVDALVFTAGVGENSAEVRKLVAARLAFLGVDLDVEANRAARPDCDVASRDSAVSVLVIRAREELVIARAVRVLLSTD